ncbi:L,D-transpeptidase family protein [Neobacillus sp. NRS-1170]|uniref:L,D-transpeptidase family protein n=1 Tax=Neobacillus sp. NRS-1170 TaxID=3233898 RepID=UPI003D289C68
MLFKKRGWYGVIHTVKAGETLPILSANYRVSLRRLYAANPGIGHLHAGQKIQIPGLPEPSTIPFSIQISVGKRRLVLYKNGRLVRIFPIAVGRMLTNTPTGEFVIVNRQYNPGGPFGVLWMSLSKQGYGIHGTNDPSSIGKAVSHGCVRMYNRDVLQLADMVPNGTRVVISP